MEQRNTQVGGAFIAPRSGRDVATLVRARFTRWARPVVLAALATLWHGVSAAQECVCDCDGDGVVEVNELILCVGIDLGVQPVSACQAGVNAQGVVDVSQLVTGVHNSLEGCSSALVIAQPSEGLLVLAGMVAAEIDLPDGIDPASLAVRLDGADVTDQLTVTERTASGNITDVGAGQHTLTASADLHGMPLGKEVHFEAAALTNPDECEILNQAHCLLPFPSSRFLVSDSSTATGVRVHLPASGMPVQNGAPLDPAPYAELDGFSPAGAIMMHFPGGVDVAASNASRLSPVTRSYDARSLDPDSPTVLLDADSGERILHFVELDAHAADTPERQMLLLQPGRSLTPGHHYIVAVRHLVHPDGSAVTAEPAFAALRDHRPCNIAAIKSRRREFQRIFTRLRQAGIKRRDLVLAFDFVIQSDTSMNRDMLSMRDQAFAWLAEQEAAGAQTFTVTATQDFDCSAPNTFFGREVTGTFQVPLFLTSDPLTAPRVPARFNRGSDGLPAPNGITNPPFTFAIPCAALRDGGSALPGVVLGHNRGLSGQDYVEGLIAAGNTDLTFFSFPELVVAGTDWTGSTPAELLTYQDDILKNLNLGPSFVDRTRQGMLNTLILTRLVHHAAFNADPAFRAPSVPGVLAAPGAETFFAGRSLGGALGIMFSALSPDVERILVEVPGSLALFSDRSAEYPFIVGPIGISDPLELALTIRLVSDASAASDLQGYATHVTADPLPATNVKNVLVTLAMGDQAVSNLNVEWLARTLGIPNLVGSVLHDLPQIPDRPGPLASALVVNDFGAFNPDDPAQEPFLPPLENLPPAQCSLCDTHGIPPIFVPTAAEQLIGFFTPGGVIENHCNGLCDGAEPAERAYNWPTRCDPFHPWFVPFDFCS